jgi:tetratricopeptide (TPR) repeat protein
VLGKLRQQGDKSEATAIGLGTGLMSQARVLDSLNKRAEARQHAQEGADVMKPLMAAPNPSVPLRRAYGLAMTYLGFSQGRANEEEAAVATLDQARDAYRSIDGLKLDDLPAAVAYAEASAWQMDALRTLGRFDQVRKVGEEAARVAGQVMERRPGQMSALRARALILDNLATTEAFDLHQRKALALAEQGAHDWEAIVKLDPTNQIAWNNLAGARMTAGFLSWAQGETRGAQEQWRGALAVERNVKEAAFVSGALAIAAGYLTMLEADLGNRQAAEAALRDNRRLIEIAVRNLPADSFGRAYVPEFMGWYGYATTGMGYGGYALPFAAGDYESVRSLARASARRIEQIKNANPARELDKNRILEVAYRTAAEASYRLRDYPAADADIKRALEIGKAIPQRMLPEKRDANAELMLAAMIAARLERFAEAQRMIEPVLKFHRELYARGKDNDDLTQHVEFAQALYVSALASPGQKTSQLAQAAAIIDGLPPATRRQISITVVRDRIAEEQKTRR